MTSGQKRTVLENITPQVDNGKFYTKHIVDQPFIIEADAFSDGHDIVRLEVQYKHTTDKDWSSTPMEHVSNDRWAGTFTPTKQGLYHYKVNSWIDYALTWQHNLERKVSDGQHVSVELLDGVEYLNKAQKLAGTKGAAYIKGLKPLFKDTTSYKKACKEAVSKKLYTLFYENPTKDFITTSEELTVYVDRKKALSSTWYEFFPRSAAKEADKHGTFKDCEDILPYVAEMGFDVVYFPPVHPIGKEFRKGKNNAVTAKVGEPGSPWAIGNQAGGHTSLHAELGTLADFKRLIKKAKTLGIEIAMDFALQCAPDHPFVKEHPQWFKWRADGSVQYAENPPKKYQDILPIYFETDDWQNLWDELTAIALYWVKQGVTIFRVDNPHTKPFGFWHYLISKVKENNPNVLFLSEAFTRPKIMQRLAKVGFSQSYTYFTWRNTKQELITYVTELTQTELKDYFRPNFWPNTPDINPYILQGGQQALYITRYVLAATLSSNTGIYGPVYEQMVHEALIGKEEYLDSEKYEIKHWDWSKTNKLKSVITIVNQARKEHPALQQTNSISFCTIENDQLIGYYKSAGDDRMLIVVNLDPYHRQSGWVQVPLQQLGIKEDDDFRVRDVVTDQTYLWNKEWNYIELDPNALPFHLFKILV